MSSTRSTSPHGGDASGGTTPPSLMKQNQELRMRLQDEANNYRRRLDTYKQAQQNQAVLVGRLQNKVLQYKQRCNDLEGKIHDVLPVTPRSSVRDTFKIDCFVNTFALFLYISLCVLS